MSENKTKKIVHIFQVTEINDSSANNEPMGCGPGCGSGNSEILSGCNCGVPAIGIDEMLTKFSEKHGNKAEIKLADYSSDNAILKTLDALNLVLKESNEKLVVTPVNMDMVLAQSAPIIAIDGKIVSTRIVPPVDQLAKAIDGDLNAITINSDSCC